MKRNNFIKSITYRRPPRKDIKAKQTERGFQVSCARYLDTLGLLWFHPPNGGHRITAVAAKMKREGVKKGVPDLIILEPRGECHGLFVELKVPGNTVSPHQVDFLQKAWDRNFSVAVCYDFDSFVEVVHDYLNQNHPDNHLDKTQN